jgi:hypothetical protein
MRKQVIASSGTDVRHSPSQTEILALSWVNHFPSEGSLATLNCVIAKACLLT